MSITNLLARGFDPMPAGGQANALMQVQQLRAGQQRNLLLQQQMQAAQAAQAEQAQNNALMRDLVQSIPSPQMQASQQALQGGGGPTVANAAKMPQVDPRTQMLHTMMQQSNGKLVSPVDYVNQAMPAPEKPQYKVVGDALVSVGPGGVKEAYKATPKPAAAPSAIAEYEYAKGQGYGGTYEQWVKEKARAGASSTSVSYSTPVEAVDSAGNRVFIRTTKDGMTPAIIPGVRPPMSAAEERAGAEKAQRERQGQQMSSAMEDAKRILSSGKATASGVGNLVDAGARMVGQTTVGAQDAARLEALSGWLVANVPRMEGPQSNFDVQNYTTMAGKVGDRTVPIKERLQALDTVQTLQRKYAEINGTPAPAPAKAGGVVDWGSLK